MTAQPAPPRPFADLDGCPRCGAHRWRETSRPDTYCCDECNAVAERNELVSIGRD